MQQNLSLSVLWVINKEVKQIIKSICNQLLVAKQLESLFSSSQLPLFNEMYCKYRFSAILTYNEAYFISNVSKFLRFLESDVGDLHQEIFFNSDFSHTD